MLLKIMVRAVAKAKRNDNDIGLVPGNYIELF